MNIAFIDFVFERHLPVGTSGLSDVVWRMAGPLAEQGHAVHVVGPYAATDYPAPRVQVHPFDLPAIGYRNIVGHVLIVQRAIQVLRRFGPFDVIHAPEYLSTALLCLAEPATPIVLTEPGNIFDRIANGNPYDWWTTQVYKWAARTSARKCAKIIATSDEMAYWWQRSGASEQQIVRIPLGVDLAGFTRVEQARATLGWSTADQHLLFVARLSPETGAHYLLEALPRMLHEFPRARLHIVGSGPAEEALRRVAAELHISDRVAWYGWLALEALPRYYSAADVVVFPGTSGGTPRIMLQAMACGTPFVGSAIGGITDHVIHGQTGLLVPPQQPAALAEAILDVLRDPQSAAERADRAREYAHTLNWARITERVQRDVYQAVVQRGDLCAVGI